MLAMLNNNAVNTGAGVTLRAEKGSEEASSGASVNNTG